MPAVAADHAGLADNAVAGYQHGDGVAADCGTDGAAGFGMSDARGECAVVGKLPTRDVEQGLPDFELERRAFDVQGERLLRRLL